MARKKPQGRGNPLPPPVEDSGLMWSVLGFISVVGAILLFVGGSLPSWRVSPPITYHYMASSSPVAEQYLSSTYGLYMLYFNGGASARNWYRLQSQVCQATSLERTAAFVTTNCGSACSGHYYTRCSAYSKLQFWGYFTLGTIIVCACLALLASAWVFVFGVNRVVLQLLWLGGGVAALAVSGAWIFASETNFSALMVQSQFPYPVLSTAAFITIAGASLLTLCGIVALILGYLADRAAWAERQAEIRRRVLGDTGAPDGFGFPAGGLMMGMPNPNAFRPQLPGGAPPGLGGQGPPGGQRSALPGTPGLYGPPPVPPPGRALPGNAGWGPGPPPHVDAGSYRGAAPRHSHGYR